MNDEKISEKDETTSAGQNANGGAVVEHESIRFPASPRQVFIMAALLLVVLAAVAYLFWPRQAGTRGLVEKPPTLESSREGDAPDEHSQVGAIEVDDETADLIGLKTEKVISGEVEDTIATVGRSLVSPNGQALIGAKTDGRAVRIFAEPGQTVKAGQPLIVIDSPQVADLRGQLIEAGSKLKLAEQNLARVGKSENRAAVIQAKNKMDFAEKSLERKRRLAALGAAAGREVAEAEVEFKNAKAEYDYLSNVQVTRESQQAISEVEQTRAVIARLSESLAALGASTRGEGGSLTIASPIAGTVVDRHISVGQAVTMGSELMTVMNLSSVIIEAQLPESQVGRIQTGQRIVARLPGLPGTLFEGHIESVGDMVDTQKRTVPVRARITNAGSLLKHEMAVEVRISTGARKQGLLVPVAALVEDEGVKVVYVKEGNRYERRPVIVGTINYKWAEILSGVEEGEEVVTASAYQLKNMQKGGEGGELHDDH